MSPRMIGHKRGHDFCLDPQKEVSDLCFESVGGETAPSNVKKDPWITAGRVEARVDRTITQLGQTCCGHIQVVAVNGGVRWLQ
jgi:hypothetical protein